MDPDVLKKSLKLFTDKHSVDLIERHKHAVKKVAIFYQRGILLKDLPTFARLLRRLHGLCLSSDQYKSLLHQLLSLVSQRFVKLKVSDESTYKEEASSFLTALGKLAEKSSICTKVKIAKEIAGLYTSQVDQNQYSFDYQHVSDDFINTIFSPSTVCFSITQGWNDVSDEEYVYEILSSLKQISTQSSNCDNMLKAGIASSLCLRLHFYRSNYRLLFVGVEVIWNLLELGNKDELIRQMFTEDCLRCLNRLFVHQSNHCAGRADRQLRNDLLVIISTLASLAPTNNSKCVGAGTVKLACVFATYPELECRLDYVRNVRLTNSSEDFELKKLLLNSIVLLSSHDYAVETMCKNHLLAALLTHVRPMTSLMTSPSMTSSSWNMAEREELQLQALSVLETVVTQCPDQWMVAQGNTVLLMFLEWCVSSDEFGGHGNSLYGYCGRGSKCSQMRYCIRVLRSLCSTDDESVIQDLTDQGAINQIISILECCSRSVDSNDDVDVEMQSNMLFVLSTITLHDQHKKELFGEKGTKILLCYLKGYLCGPCGPLSHNKLVLSATDCICSAVLGCSINENVFLDFEGAFLLIDLLQECSKTMQGIVMTTLLDLTVNNRTVEHMKLWRGKEGLTIGKLLVGVWVQEERRLGVGRDPRGVITDIKSPLKTLNQQNDMTSSSPSILDVSDNLRSKIYALFFRLGFDDVTGVSSEDYVTLAIIERYMDFKTLEVWQEMVDELEREGVEPVSSDVECMQVVISRLEDTAVNVAHSQRKILESCADKEIMNELNYYEQFRETKRQSEKAYEDFLDYVDRTSDHLHLKRARMRQLKCIDRSRLLSRTSINQSTIKHTTQDRVLQTTVFCERHVVVESTKLDNNVIYKKKRRSELSVL